MLNDVKGSIMFSTASPLPFMSISRAQGEPALICGNHRAPVMDLLILVFYGKCKPGFRNHPQDCLVRSGLIETVLGGTTNLLAMARIDVGGVGVLY